MNFLSILFPQTIYKSTSQFSGEIKVIDHVFERRLVVGGLTQSGGITKKMWEKAIDVLRSKYKVLSIKNVLILGLGAGTVAKVISEKFPSGKIVGIEIDPAIIHIGKKYFGLDFIKNLEIIIDDAVNIIHNTKYVIHNTHYDLIIVDLYNGKHIEKNIQNEFFLQHLAQNLTKNGVVIFNVVKLQNDNFEAKVFLDKLGRIYKDYFCKRIIVNDFFFCTNHHRRR